MKAVSYNLSSRSLTLNRYDRATLGGTDSRTNLYACSIHAVALTIFKTMRNKIKYKLYKVLGKSKLYETSYGIKVVNPVHFRGQVFEYKEVTVNPTELYLGCDALNDDYTLVGKPISQSPHFELVKLLSEDKTIDDCEYIRRKEIGTLDGRDGVALSSSEKERHYMDYARSKNSLLNNTYEQPILYKVDGKYYIYDGKHRAAMACLLGVSIRCKVLEIYSYSRDIYSNLVYQQMKKSPARYSKNLSIYNQYIPTTQPRCLVVNRCKTDNLGDQAIGLSMCRLLNAIGENCDLNEFSKENGNINIDINSTHSKAKSLNQTNTKHNYTIRQYLRDAKWRLQSNNLFQRLRLYQYDYILIGGGELIQSNGQFPLALYEWCKNIRKYQHHARIVLFAVGATATYTNHDKQYIEKALKLVDEIYVRDETSQRNLLEIYNKNSKVIPDVVFFNSISGESNENINRNYVLYGITDPKRILRYGLIANDAEEYYEHCYFEISKLKDVNPQKEILLFYTTKSDRDACLEFQEYVLDKHSFKIEMQETKDLSSLMNSLQKSSFVVSPRMHGCILSCIAGCDCHPVLMSNKMKSFNEILNQGINLTEKRDLIISAIRDIIQK